MMSFVLKLLDFTLKMMGFVFKIMTGGPGASGQHLST